MVSRSSVAGRGLAELRPPAGRDGVTRGHPPLGRYPKSQKGGKSGRDSPRTAEKLFVPQRMRALLQGLQNRVGKE